MKATIKQAFVLAGMPEEKAEACAQVHTESSRDGVASHGLNRVERFVEYLTTGLVDPHAVPSLEMNLGAMEIYNGNMAPGILNAIFAMSRATEIAENNGMGLVSLKNTTHWMRGGDVWLGWLQTKDILASAGPIPNRACRHGVLNQKPSAIIRL
jgi:3-dehydro-L-gulonate 2-dehydrogenase